MVKINLDHTMGRSTTTKPLQQHTVIQRHQNGFKNPRNQKQIGVGPRFDIPEVSGDPASVEAEYLKTFSLLGSQKEHFDTWRMNYLNSLCGCFTIIGNPKGVAPLEPSERSLDFIKAQQLFKKLMNTH